MKVRNNKTVKVKTSTVKAIAKRMCKQLFRVWPTLRDPDYQDWGVGAANLRGVEIEIVPTYRKGTDIFFTEDKPGTGFLRGHRVSDNVMHCGNTVLTVPPKKIVARFGNEAAAVAYVRKHGKLQIKGTPEYPTLSNGGKCSIYIAHGRLCKYNGGKGTGRHDQFKQGGKMYGHAAISR